MKYLPISLYPFLVPKKGVQSALPFQEKRFSDSGVPPLPIRLSQPFRVFKTWCWGGKPGQNNGGGGVQTIITKMYLQSWKESLAESSLPFYDQSKARVRKILQNRKYTISGRVSEKSCTCQKILRFTCIEEPLHHRGGGRPNPKPGGFKKCFGKFNQKSGGNRLGTEPALFNFSLEWLFTNCFGV